MADRPFVSRIVHLQGGLRAVDAGSDRIFAQIHASKRLLHFPAPEYADLYASLMSLGFHVIGVEFMSEAPFRAPDWWFAPPEGRFGLTAASRSWGEMRHLAYKEHKPKIVDISRRCTVLLELLGLRLLQMSNAYNGTYLAQVGNRNLADGILFDNTYTPHIEAAIHAFLADATNLRDLLSEFVWTYVLHQEEEVKSFKTFRSRAKSFQHPVAVSIIEAGTTGWLKRLSQLRNDVIHVAPIGAHHTFPACHTRSLALPDRGIVCYVSYGLVDRTSVQSTANDSSLSQNENLVRAEIHAYKERLDVSDDALEFAWAALGKLITLCEMSREASGLHGETQTIGPEDIINSTMSG